MKIVHIILSCALIILFSLPIVAKPQQAQNQSKECIDINTAQEDQLMNLPNVGKVMAKRIVEYREKHGLFKRPQDILIIRGISAKRYRQMASQICVIHRQLSNVSSRKSSPSVENVIAPH